MSLVRYGGYGGVHAWVCVHGAGGVLTCACACVGVGSGGEHKIRNGLMRRSVVLVSPFEGEAPPPHREPEHLPVATGVDGGVSMPPHTPDSRAHRGSQDPEATAMVHSWLQATHAHAPPDAVPDAHPEIHPGVESVDPEATATQSPRTMAAALAAELARHPGESRSGFHGKTSPGDRSDHTTSFASYTSSACKTPELGVMVGGVRTCMEFVVL